ncbi:MAG: pyroglutamyl-peptidase I [Hyphomicrobiales bacterium]
MPTLLITGFGPFPGAPFNPTIQLVEELAQLKRPALADVKIVSHIFETSYAAVDRELPALLAQHKPDALLMFGLAAATRFIRIETRARNALTLLPDASGQILRRNVIAEGGLSARTMPAPQRRLLAAARTAGLAVRLSRDAGRYLCNYLCWKASEAGGPGLAAFVHVPLVPRDAAPEPA